MSIAGFFKRPTVAKILEEMLPDEDKRAQVVHIHELISTGQLEEAERLTHELDPRTRDVCLELAIAIQVGMQMRDILQERAAKRN